MTDLVPIQTNDLLPEPAGPYDFTLNGYMYQRAWRLTFGAQPGVGIVFTSESSTVQPANPLRIVFDIERNTQMGYNRGKIEVYNMNEQSNAFYAKGTQIYLEAGYPGNMHQIFSSTTKTTASHKIMRRSGPDVIATFEIGEAESELDTYISLPYPGGTPYLKIIKDIIKEMGLPSTINYVDSKGSPITKTVGFGYVASGGAKQILNSICKTLGLENNMQNGALCVYPKGRPLGSFIAPAVVISQETGMIGVPTQGTGTVDNLTSFDSLLNPKLLPSTLCQIKSKYFSGNYLIKNSHFEGDTHSSKWQVHCECTDQKAIDVAIQASQANGLLTA